MSSCVLQYTQSYAVKLPLDTSRLDRTALHNSGAINRYKHGRVDCEEYIGDQAELLQKGSENT